MSQMLDNHALTADDFNHIRQGYFPNPSRSLSLHADSYTDARWYSVDLEHIISKTWQWICHVEKVRSPGAYIAVEIAGKPIVVVRDRDGVLRAFYNVCKHRAHELLRGEGITNRIMCPYHAWTADFFALHILKI